MVGEPLVLLVGQAIHEHRVGVGRDEEAGPTIEREWFEIEEHFCGIKRADALRITRITCQAGLGIPTIVASG
jgi:hypothetical protein